MSRFNKSAISVQKTINLAGGEAFKESPELELVSILLTSFVQDQFYRKASDTVDRVKALLPHVDPKFAAKAALFARNEFKMRSITHVTAGEIAKNVKGQPWTKKFFQRVFYRPDDITETFAYYISNYGKRPIPNSLKKGAALKLKKFDDYSLAKYRGEGKAVKLVDVVNLIEFNWTPAIKKIGERGT